MLPQIIEKSKIHGCRQGGHHLRSRAISAEVLCRPHGIWPADTLAPATAGAFAPSSFRSSGPAVRGPYSGDSSIRPSDQSSTLIFFGPRRLIFADPYSAFHGTLLLTHGRAGDFS